MENFNNIENRQKINVVVVSILVAGLLIGGVAGGALYAFIFDKSETTQQSTSLPLQADPNEQAEVFELSGELSSYSHHANSWKGGGALQQLAMKQGMYSCDFEIKSDNVEFIPVDDRVAPAPDGARTYVAAVIPYRDEQQIDGGGSDGFTSVATIQVLLVNQQGLGAHSYENIRTQDILYKLYSNWDGIIYKGSFGLRSIESANYPIMSIGVHVNEGLLTKYSSSFSWDLSCTPIKESTDTPQDAFTYAETGQQFFQAPPLNPGDYNCSIDVVDNKPPEHSKYDQPYLVGGGGIYVSSYTNYHDYSQEPKGASLVRTRVWNEGKSFFNLNVQDEQPLISVTPDRAENEASWIVACNKLNPEDKVRSFKREGINFERFYSNLQSGTYSCVSNAHSGSVEYPDQDELVKLEYVPGSGGTLDDGVGSFEIIVKGDSAPYIALDSNYHGYGGEWTVECNPK